MYDEIEFPPYSIEKLADEILNEEIEAIPGALHTGKTKIDPITLSVVLARAEGIMSEMTETILVFVVKISGTTRAFFVERVWRRTTRSTACGA